MTARTLQALRNLAARPGTEAEGQLARELLARAEAKRPTGDGILGVFQRHLPWEASTDEFLEAIRDDIRRRGHEPLPTEGKCACGCTFPMMGRCRNRGGHLEARCW